MMNKSAISTTTVAAGEGRLKLLVVGEFDIAAKNHVVHAALDALDVAGVTELLIDLSRTSFMDASGAYALERIQAVWSASGLQARVVGVRGMIAEVLYLTGVAEPLGLPLRIGPRPHERREPHTGPKSGESGAPRSGTQT